MFSIRVPGCGLLGYLKSSNFQLIPLRDLFISFLYPLILPSNFGPLIYFYFTVVCSRIFQVFPMLFVFLFCLTLSSHRTLPYFPDLFIINSLCRVHRIYRVYGVYQPIIENVLLLTHLKLRLYRLFLIA